MDSNKRKLKFNKETIAMLNEKQKQMMKGGANFFAAGTYQTGQCTFAYTCNGAS